MDAVDQESDLVETFAYVSRISVAVQNKALWSGVGVKMKSVERLSFLRREADVFETKSQVAGRERK